MKFASAIAALVVLPSTAAFVVPSATTTTTSSRNPAVGRETTSLNLFLDRFFKNRRGTEKEEIKAVVKGFQKSSNLSEQVKKVRGPTPEEEKANLLRLESEPNFKHQPSKDVTGCSQHIARIAATLSYQLYSVNRDTAEAGWADSRLDDYMLNTDDLQTTVIIDDRKGLFKTTNPPFAAAVCGTTMLLGWRGSSVVTDWINDAAMSPCSQPTLGKHAKSIKLHGGMSSLCNNDFVVHQDKIIAECKKRGIKKIVTTGHSLGASLAQVAHTLIRAQMQDKNSPWSELKDLGVTVQSLGFSAPMTTLIVDDGAPISKETEEFLEEINENSCVIVFKNDPFPRFYGYTSYYVDFAEDVSSGVGKYLLNDKPFPFIASKYAIDRFAGFLEQAVVKSDSFVDLLGCLSNYVHLGTIVYYADYDAFPVVLKDYGFNYAENNKPKSDAFRSVTYEPFENKGDLVNDIWLAHFGPLSGMKYKRDKMN